jgi:hypothetical protein
MTQPNEDAAPPLNQITAAPVPDPEPGVIATNGQQTDGIGSDPTPAGIPDAGTQPIDSNAN